MLAKLLTFDHADTSLALHIDYTADCDSDNSADHAALTPHDCRTPAEPTNLREAELLALCAMAPLRPLLKSVQCVPQLDDGGYLQVALVAVAY